MKTTRAIVVVLWGLAVGCGGEGGGGGGILPGIPVSTDPVPASQAFQVPRAAAAEGAVEVATEAATNSILDLHTQGAASGEPQPFLSPPSFEFTSHVEFDIDLDAQGRAGNDRFPNASGVIHVVTDGLLQGTWMSGEASYSLVISAAGDVTVTDPGAGTVTLIPDGSSWTCALEVTWDVTDSQNWLVVATATKAIELEGLTVTEGDVVTTVSVVGARQVTTGIAKVDGVVVKEKTVEGSFTITVDDGSVQVTVLIEFTSDGLILATVGGEQFGPFTPEEFREFFGNLFV
jgi:hypothetical protein